MSARLLVVLLVTLTLAGSAAPSSQTQAEVSLAFQDLGPVLTAAGVGLPAGDRVWGPTAAVLPDGRIRLYYRGPSGIGSAISADGLHFTPEPGQRWYDTRAHIEQLPDGRWRLYYTHSTPAGPDGIASAISSDGLSFTDEPGLRLANPQPGWWGLSCCGIVKLADGRYRMYVSALQYQPGAGSTPPQVYSAVSSDLSTWTLEPGVRLTAGPTPAVLTNPDGSTLLVGSSGWLGGAIQTASSPDGLTFTSPVATNLSGGDPAFVTLSDGRLLMYYSVGDPATIHAALAVRVTAPAVSYPSPAVTAISATSARVSALIDPRGATTHYSFEYGKSTGYGEATDVTDVPAPTGQQTVGATLTGLSPSTTYHFRVDAYNSVGHVEGSDQSFTTARCRPQQTRDHGWEVALAHAKTRTAAGGALRKARKIRGGRALVEQDGCADYETAIPNLTRKGSVALWRRAKRRGFPNAVRERT